MKILCPNRDCRPSGKTASGNVIRFGFYQTRWEKRSRYRCQTCEKTFCSNTGTPYYRLQHRRATFDQVATLSVEGLNKSAIARVERIGWNGIRSIAGWKKRATAAVASTIKEQPGLGPRNFRPTRSERSSKLNSSRPG